MSFGVFATEEIHHDEAVQGLVGFIAHKPRHFWYSNDNDYSTKSENFSSGRNMLMPGPLSFVNQVVDALENTTATKKPQS